MKIAEKLQKKVTEYLGTRKIQFQDKSVKYVGIMSNFAISEEENRDIHVIRFGLESNLSDQVKICYVYANTDTEKLEYIMTPHFSEKIS